MSRRRRIAIAAFIAGLGVATALAVPPAAAALSYRPAISVATDGTIIVEN
jgi:hypothetical protein